MSMRNCVGRNSVSNGGWTLAIKSRGDSLSACRICVASLFSYALLTIQTLENAVHVI